MNTEKYIGLDVHQATISVAVRDAKGKLVMESILETKAATILEFFSGLRGSLFVTFEEGTWAAWLYDLLKPRVAKLVVCNPRKNALLKHGNKNDRIDARKLAELLRLNNLEPVYHGQNGVRMLRELARSYLWLANCYFSQDSSGLPVLLRFCDARSGRSFHPLPRYPGPLARTWRRPLHSCGVASPQAPTPDRESPHAPIAESMRVGPHPRRLDGALGASYSSAPVRNRTEALNTARPSQSLE
jgi:hypothetical protein